MHTRSGRTLRWWSDMAAHLTLISDRPVNDYEAFFVDLMHGLDKHKIRSVAVVAVLEEPEADGGDAIVGYHAMGMRDQQLAASLIEADIVYRIAQNAVRDMLDLPEPDEEEY